MKTYQIFCGVFFAKSFQTIPLCQNCPKAKSAKRAKYYQQTSHNFNKTADCSHRHQRGMFVLGVPSDVQSRYEQPSTFLRLCSSVDNRQCIKSPMGVAKMNSTEKGLTLNIFDCIPVQGGVVLS